MERKGKFDRDATSHLPDEVKALLASGEDTEYDDEYLLLPTTERIQSPSVQSSSLEILLNRP